MVFIVTRDCNFFLLRGIFHYYRLSRDDFEDKRKLLHLRKNHLSISHSIYATSLIFLNY